MCNLEQIAASYQKNRKDCARRVIICAGTGCIANGSLKVHAALKRIASERGLDVTIELKGEDKHDVLLSKSGCQGFCQVGPLVTIEPEGFLYTHVKPEDAEEIVHTTLQHGKAVDRLLYRIPADQTVCPTTQDIPFYARQTRNVLDKCGRIDPENIDEYIADGGYVAARKAWLELTPEEICNTYKEAGLRGKGGGGFSAGVKWDLSRKQPSEDKYIICNGDEGDPGAFMDRSVLEGNPHSVIEGMLIAARGSKANHGYVYVRMEYPLACARIRKAIVDAEQQGILGDNIFGSGHSFDIKVMEGAGAFVCGEGSAMIASIEGGRGMPRTKPPRSAEVGLFGKPTVINNVETLATVPQILRHGVEKFRSIGTEKSPGTKAFALTGHVANTGLIEVPFGTTIREIVFNIGGGVINDNGEIDNDSFKAVQIGGPSGGCLTADHLDVPLDFDSLSSIGAMVGSGGLVVMNKSTCMVRIASFFMKFTQHESCGKCVPCREGTRQMLELLEDITEGRADETTIPLLEDTAETVQITSLCGLGKSAPSPVLSTLRYFRDEYDAHVVGKYCPTRECSALVPITIDPNICVGCTLCKRSCPVGAITGTVKQPHSIDPEKCIKCGACIEVCKFKAIS